MSLLYSLSIFLYLFICFLLCLIVLIQEGKSGNLGASFGGGDSGDSLFGTSTPEIVKKFTGYLAILFVAVCLLLSFWTAKLGRQMVSSQPTTELVK